MLRHISLLSVLALSLSCTPGPQGVAGEPGPAGAKGEPGADGRDGREGDDGTSCSVTDNGDGTKTIICGDGTSVTVADGANGADGQPGERGPRGDAGPAGPQGPRGDAGPAGVAGTSCTVQRDDAAGLTTITCEDGTSATVLDGADRQDGDEGSSCTVNDNGDGTKTISCEDGTSVTVTDGATGETGDRGPRGDAGPPGADGSLVRLEPELGGPICPYSGTQILIGIDDDGDGILQDDEVDDEAVVCSSSPGDCAPDFHAEGDGVCVSDTRDCVVLNGAGTETWTGTAWGACVVDSCNTSYHKESGACVSDTRDCVVLNGTGTETWTGTAWGSCVLGSCNTGYREESGACELNVIPDPTGATYAPIPAGTFTMGSPTTELGRDSDETQHEVTLTRPFAMATTEVTQGQWKAMSGGTNPSYVTNCGDDCPVEQVDWYSTLGYANALSEAAGLEKCYTLIGCNDDANGWHDGQHSGCTDATFTGLDCAGYRLPTEAEWEYAYRAGTTTLYYNGDSDAGFGDIAWYMDNANNTAHPVGQKTPNAWGLYDMSGNVSEWTWDWYGTYPGATVDYIGPGTGTYRVLRGGSCYSFADDARAAHRNDSNPASRINLIGFRLTRTLP